MKLLFFSNLFPDRSQPQRGLDNRVLLEHLADRGCQVRVISPRPRLPFVGRDQTWQAGERERRFEPRYLPVGYVPKMGGAFNHLLMASAARRALVEEGDYDGVLASWLFPDGVAISRVCAKPHVLIAQGSDVHVYLRSALRRRAILGAVDTCSALVTRSHKLGTLLRGAGAKGGKLHTIYNGVDTALFHPGSRIEARAALGLPEGGRVLLFLGNLLPVKDPVLMLEAFAQFWRSGAGQDARLIFVGDGVLKDALQRLAAGAGVGDRVVFAGRQPPERVAQYLRAADFLCMTSKNEGLPNVVLESLASGVPVVATDVGGIGEVVQSDFLGRMVKGRDPRSFAGALQECCGRAWDAGQIGAHASQYSWESATAKYLRLLQEFVCPEPGQDRVG